MPKRLLEVVLKASLLNAKITALPVLSFAPSVETNGSMTDRKSRDLAT